jgi:hypothetical protein
MDNSDNVVIDPSLMLAKNSLKNTFHFMTSARNLADYKKCPLLQWSSVSFLSS